MAEKRTEDGLGRDMPRSGLALLALGLPVTLLFGLTLWAPFASVTFLGIRGSIWCLFACAPATSLCLLACNRLFGAQGKGQGEGKP
ncbi:MULTISPECIES: hypothetical protein [Nitrospirillum]|uniref:Uncharacterized protein n=1 Tax=Nitrospirillum amazonense TaxID=28077 RepID=A0A560GE57_9PROT|nr:hypothetical protein [Nitrospirillum amazonense]MEC4590978.1 hypothetical protein [Nitrospirillum amazonense]TWB32109.1 hypothetical protein FBZ88_101481 [Nitrospirillum amazonense]